MYKCYPGKNETFEGDIPGIGNNMSGGLMAKKSR